MFTVIVTIGTLLMIGPNLTEAECYDIGEAWASGSRTPGMVQCVRHTEGQNYEIVWQKRWP